MRNTARKAVCFLILLTLSFSSAAPAHALRPAQPAGNPAGLEEIGQALTPQASVQAEVEELVQFLEASIRYPIRDGRPRMDRLHEQMAKLSRDLSGTDPSPRQIDRASVVVRKGWLTLAEALETELTHGRRSVFVRAADSQKKIPTQVQEALKALGRAAGQLHLLSLKTDPAQVKELVSRTGRQMNTVWEFFNGPPERPVLRVKKLPKLVDPAHRQMTKVLPATLRLIANYLDRDLFPALAATGEGVSWAGLYREVMKIEEVRAAQPSLNFPIEEFIGWLNDGTVAPPDQRLEPFSPELQRVIQKRLYYAGPLISDLLNARAKYPGSVFFPDEEIEAELRGVVSQFVETLQGPEFGVDDLRALALQTAYLLRYIPSAGAEEAVVEAVRAKYGAVPYAVGVRVGGTNISTALVNAQGEVETATALPETGWRNLPDILRLLGNPPAVQVNDRILSLIRVHSDDVLTPDQQRTAARIADRISDEIVRHIAALITDTGLPLENFQSVHVAFPGPVDPATGRVGVPYAASNVPGFENYSLADKIRKDLRARLGVNIRVDVENDSPSGLKGERSPSGTAAGLKNVVTFIWGTGMNADSDAVSMYEVGHGLVGKIGADGLTHYELRDTRQSRPELAPGEFELEQRLGGEALKAGFFQPAGFKDGAEVTAQAAAGNAKALVLIDRVGADFGRALAALLAHYYKQDKFVPEKVVLISGVSEQFGLGVKNAQGKDALIDAVQQEAFDALTQDFGVDPETAQKMASVVVRTKMDARREFAAAAEGLKTAGAEESRLESYAEFEKWHKAVLRVAEGAESAKPPAGPFLATALWDRRRALEETLYLFKSAKKLEWFGKSQQNVRALLQGNVDKIAEDYRLHYTALTGREVLVWKAEQDMVSLLERSGADAVWLDIVGKTLSAEKVKPLVSVVPGSSVVAAILEVPQLRVRILVYKPDKLARGLVLLPSLHEFADHLYQIGMKAHPKTAAFSAIANAKSRAEMEKLRKEKKEGSSAQHRALSVPAGAADTPPGGLLTPQLFKELGDELLYMVYSEDPLSIIRHRWAVHPNRDQWPQDLAAKFIAERLRRPEEQIAPALALGREKIKPGHPFAEEPDAAALLKEVKALLPRRAREIQGLDSKDAAAKILPLLDKNEKPEGDLALAVELAIYRIGEADPKDTPAAIAHDMWLTFEEAAGAEELGRSHNGKFLVTRWTTGTDAHLRYADTQLIAASLARHNRPVTAAAFSPDDTLLALGDSAGLVSLWALPSGELKGTLPPKTEGAIAQVAFEGRPDLLAVTTSQGVTSYWDIPRRKLISQDEPEAPPAGAEESFTDIEQGTVLRKGDILGQKEARGENRYWVEGVLADGSVYARILGDEGLPGPMVRTLPRSMLAKNYQLVQPVFFGPEQGLPRLGAAALITQTLAADLSLKGVYFEGRKMPAMERGVAILRPDRFLQEMRAAVADFRYVLFRSGSWMVARAVVGSQEKSLKAKFGLWSNQPALNFIAPNVPIPETVSQAFHRPDLWLDFYEEARKKPLYPDTQNVRDAVELTEELWMKLLAPFYAGGAAAFQNEFELDVTPPSGVLANVAVQSAVLKAGDSMMGLTLQDGGQMTEGAAGSLAREFFKILPIPVTPERDIDYDALRKQLLEMEPEKRPRLLLVGGTAFVYKIRFQRLREIVDEVNRDSAAKGSTTRLLFAVDLTQNFLQMLGGAYDPPVDWADFITWSVRHQGGQQGGMVLTRTAVIPEINRNKGVTDPERQNRIRLSQRVQKTVFPGTRASYSAREIVAKAALAHHLLTSKEFRTAAGRIPSNAGALAQALQLADPRLRIRGSGETHQILVDVRGVKEGMTGQAASQALESVGMMVPHNPFRDWADESSDKPVIGLRISVKPLTILGWEEAQFRMAGRLIAETIEHADPKTGELDPAIQERIQKEVTALLDHRGSVPAGAEEGTSGLEEANVEAFGVVAVEGVVAAVPAWAKASVYGVTVGLAQTRAAVELGTVPSAQLIAVAAGAEEAQAIAALGVPEVQIVETKAAGIQLAQGILETIGGFSQVRILDATAATLRELRLWLQQLPAAWQGSLTAGLEEQVLQLEELSQVGV